MGTSRRLLVVVSARQEARPFREDRRPSRCTRAAANWLLPGPARWPRRARFDPLAHGIGVRGRGPASAWSHDQNLLRPWRAALVGHHQPADVMNRDPREMALVSGGARVVGDGALAVASDANVVFCQLAPWEFEYQKHFNQKRTFRRVSCLVTRVLGNMGVDEPTPMLQRFSSPVKGAAEENRWLVGFYLDKPEEFDDPYPYFQW